MRISPSRTARTAVRSLLLPVAVGGLLVVSAPPAAAHTELNGSDPANGAVLDAVPRTVTLTFSDPMSPTYAQLAVTGPDGTALGDGAPAVAGREVTLSLKAARVTGRYTVGYRVVSADGHPVSGTSAFTVRPARTTLPSATAPASPAGTTPPAPASSAPAVAPSPTATSASPSPTASLSRTAVASGERAVTSLKAIGVGFGIGIAGMVTAMVVTVRRRRRSADDAGR
ncbi:copper resistance CopC family protein [Streptomyces hydrogenans]|uniref:copper resistance CopC family protein n=1 Tax=Streptomyces hydrogenans TaxID=1873719 RepID=UPI00341D5021